MIPDLEWQLITWRSSWRFHPVITVSVCQLTKHGKFACKPHRLSWRVLLCKESSFHFFGNKTVNECARLQANLGWVNVLAHIRFKTSEKKIDLSGTSKRFAGRDELLYPTLSCCLSSNLWENVSKCRSSVVAVTVYTLHAYSFIYLDK